MSDITVTIPAPVVIAALSLLACLPLWFALVWLAQWAGTRINARARRQVAAIEANAEAPEGTP